MNEIPEGLEDWLAKGDKPVYMGFGSIPVPDKEKLIHTLQGLLAKRRVVFGAGWSILGGAGAADGGLPTHPNLFVTKYVNHDWLLPRCSTAIIHGGIGTISAALRSGTPIIVVSILADQPVNGKMIEQKKLGYHLPFKKLSPEKLLQAINAAEAPLIKETCKTTAAGIKTEDGLGNAVNLIEKYFDHAHAK